MDRQRASAQETRPSRFLADFPGIAQTAVEAGPIRVLGRQERGAETRTTAEAEGNRDGDDDEGGDVVAEAGVVAATPCTMCPPASHGGTAPDSTDSRSGGDAGGGDSDEVSSFFLHGGAAEGGARPKDSRQERQRPHIQLVRGHDCCSRRNDWQRQHGTDTPPPRARTLI